MSVRRVLSEPTLKATHNVIPSRFDNVVVA